MTKLPILHFNDVYRVTPQNLSSNNGTIDVTQFAALIDDLRDTWRERNDRKKEGLVLFSGDVFSPSVESSVTRGSHMVPVLNLLGIDVAVTGNHDFDFGYPHLTTLIEDSQFPWLLSNIIDTRTNEVPNYLREFVTLERAGIKIGFIGLVEEAWIDSVPSWPPEFIYTSMRETGIKLSKLLRDPEGQHRCDLVIALTHSRLPNDVELAKELLALSPFAQKTVPINCRHGIDLILGGHDHLYYVARGVDSWDDFDKDKMVLGAEADGGDVLIIKSGSDFRDLSEITLELSSTPKGSVRTQVISKVYGRRHTIIPGMRSSQSMRKLLKTLLSSVDATLRAPLCKTTVLVDVRSSYIRLTESPVCDWFADILRHAYDGSHCLEESGGSADGVLICSGTFRGDATYGPGRMTMGDVLEILPFQDPVIVLELDGATLWDALENGLSKWPAQEGRFPVISGFRVEWDSSKPPGARILGLWLLRPSDNGPDVNEEVKREEGGRKYKVVTREYMAQGHDGFEALTKGKWLVDHECGATFSSIVRKYLLGSQFIQRLLNLKNQHEMTGISNHARTFIKTLDDHSEKSRAIQHWRDAFNKLNHCRHLQISMTEHMSSVDVFDGKHARKGLECSKEAERGFEDLVEITPKTDGRLKDVAKSRD